MAAKQQDAKSGHVAGFVKSHPNRDGSVTITVAGKEGRKFTLHQSNEEAIKLMGARRALVSFEERGRNPRITLVLVEPSARLILEYTKQ